MVVLLLLQREAIIRIICFKTLDMSIDMFTIIIQSFLEKINITDNVVIEKEYMYLQIFHLIKTHSNLHTILYLYVNYGELSKHERTSQRENIVCFH